MGGEGIAFPGLGLRGRIRNEEGKGKMGGWGVCGLYASPSA